MKAFFSLTAALAVLVAGAGAWYWYAAARAVTTYRTVPVERGNLVATIAASGTIEPEEVVDIGAQVAGQIKSFGKDPRDATKTIDYGTPVEQGTVLAQIDEILYKAQVDQARANLQKAEADVIQMKAKLYQAERDWKRAQALGSRKVISDFDYDTAKATDETARANVAVSEAAVAQAKAALQQAEANLGYCTIKSPVKGVIIDRRVNIGQTVVASLNAPSLFLIAKDLRRLQVWASVNEADIGHIYPGQPVHFTVDAYPEETFDGQVSQIRLNASMTQNVVTYTVVVDTDNSKGQLLPLDRVGASPGQAPANAPKRHGLLPYLTANLQFDVSQRDNVLVVPNAALRWRPQPNQVAPEFRDAFTRSLKRHSVPPGEKALPGTDKERHDRGTLWVEDGGYVRPIKVRTGLSDGTVTEIVSGEVEEETAVVVGEARPNGDGGTVNPFTPQINRNKQQ
jgi:HlyD family secretion protein